MFWDLFISDVRSNGQMSPAGYTRWGGPGELNLSIVSFNPLVSTQARSGEIASVATVIRDSKFQRYL